MGKYWHLNHWVLRNQQGRGLEGFFQMELHYPAPLLTGLQSNATNCAIPQIFKRIVLCGIETAFIGIYPKHLSK